MQATEAGPAQNGELQEEAHCTYMYTCTPENIITLPSVVLFCFT